MSNIMTIKIYAYIKINANKFNFKGYLVGKIQVNLDIFHYSSLYTFRTVAYKT